jgi:hypothetical protein
MQIVASERVRLQVDVPELELTNGDVGQVVSTWFHPNTAYEVEFSPAAGACTRRVLLLQHQIERE